MIGLLEIGGASHWYKKLTKKCSSTKDKIFTRWQILEFISYWPKLGQLGLAYMGIEIIIES